MRNRYGPPIAVLVEEIHRAPVQRYSAPRAPRRCAASARNPKTMRGAPRWPRRETRCASSARFCSVTSSMIVIVASTSPLSSSSGAAFSRFQRCTPVCTIDRADQQRLGLLATQDPHRGNVLHRDLAAVLVLHEIVAHDRRRRRVAQLLPRLKAQVGERRFVRVQEAVLAITDRHRVAERTDDRIEASLAAAQRIPQILHQPLMLTFPPLRHMHAAQSDSRPSSSLSRALGAPVEPRRPTSTLRVSRLAAAGSALS